MGYLACEACEQKAGRASVMNRQLVDLLTELRGPPPIPECSAKTALEKRGWRILRSAWVPDDDMVLVYAQFRDERACAVGYRGPDAEVALERLLQDAPGIENRAKGESV